MKTLPVMICLLLPVRAGNTLPIQNDYGAKSPVPAGAEVSLKLPEKAKPGDAIPGTFIVRNTGG